MERTGDGTSAVVVVVTGGAEVPVWRAEVPPRADLAVVDSLARLHLAARRRGWSIRLQNPGQPLCQLLGLAGLRDLFVEVDGEAEGREELGVEEVVQPDDPSP